MSSTGQKPAKPISMPSPLRLMTFFFILCHLNHHLMMRFRYKFSIFLFPETAHCGLFHSGGLPVPEVQTGYRPDIVPDDVRLFPAARSTHRSGDPTETSQTANRFSSTAAYGQFATLSPGQAILLTVPHPFEEPPCLYLYNASEVAPPMLLSDAIPLQERAELVKTNHPLLLFPRLLPTALPFSYNAHPIQAHADPHHTVPPADLAIEGIWMD